MLSYNERIETEITDRRKNKRFRAVYDAFAVLHSDSIIVTSLSDINMNGLAFEYTLDSDEYLNDAVELDIFCADDDSNDFHLQNIPFEIVSKADIVTDDHFSPKLTKRCSVKFGELTPEQQTQVEFFIRHHTSGKVKRIYPSKEKPQLMEELPRKITFVF